MTYPKIIKNSAYGRIYQVDETTFFPSVTTVLRWSLPLPEFLLKWIIEQSKGDYEKHLHHSGQASEIGTAVHEYAERVVNGEIIEITDDPLDHVPGKNYYPNHHTTVQIRKALQSFIAFYKNCKPEVEDMEMLLYSLDKTKDDNQLSDGEYKFPFMGRSDMVAQINGERWMLDIKTSKQAKNVLNYKIQLTMYTMLWNAMNPDKLIDRMGVIWCKKDFLGANPPKSTYEPIEYQYDPGLVKHVYAIFKECYDGFNFNKPKLKQQPPKVFSLADTEDGT